VDEYFTQLFTVHNVSDVRQIDIHTAEPPVPGPSLFLIEIPVAKFKKYKSPGTHQIPAERIHPGPEPLLFYPQSP
jgi:hypothetical protein